eukprot:TRINITY_DN3814_c0_g1_i1.p1 TRINITY_DN3814_c0_g1~~TRINITY_DN3814_c0_g1_i1.p1  ORF type:complete len:194 (-),score=16.09 TRINITY_DN3814_c0_g1_i1:24-605(-)
MGTATTLWFILFFVGSAFSQDCWEWSNCTSCTNSLCFWCPSSRWCVDTTTECPSGTLFLPNQCDCDEYSLTSCSKCVGSSSDCRWCDSDKLCSRGSTCSGNSRSECPTTTPLTVGYIILIVFCSLVGLGIIIALTFVISKLIKRKRATGLTFYTSAPEPTPPTTRMSYKSSPIAVQVTPGDARYQSQFQPDAT